MPATLPYPYIHVGCAGWSILGQYTEHFPERGTHLERYAQRLPAVEINSSFYRPHRPETYARWAASVPDTFQFAVKIAKEITHTRRLRDIAGPLARFLSEIAALGSKLGPLLVQLPPTLRVDAAAAMTSDVGEDTGIERVWCSPKPKKSRPTGSATCTASRASTSAGCTAQRTAQSQRAVLHSHA